jgi:hypothetical protein
MPARGGISGARPFAGDALARRLDEAFELGMIFPITIERGLQAAVDREGFKANDIIFNCQAAAGWYPLARVREGLAVATEFIAHPPLDNRDRVDQLLPVHRFSSLF